MIEPATPATIFIVDDEPSGHEVLAALLHSEHYRLVHFDSGIALLDYLAQLVHDSAQEPIADSQTAPTPDVILLDVMMPKLDGLAVCRQIKTDPNWQHVPIIIVTALSTKKDLIQGLDAGADDFLSKPVNGEELRARVRSMLRIKHQYDALEQTLRLREDLSNMVVHDLRNPLANILLSSQLLLLQTQFDPKTQDRLMLIQNSAKQLNALVNDLLMLAKMESGKLLLNRTEVNLCELLPQVINEFAVIADSKQICLSCQIQIPHPWISADANLLHRVLDNLISNALKFSPKGSTVTIQVDPSSDAQATARLKIADQGPGIDQTLRQKIFSRYEVGELMDNAAQIGLGLTFCKMVVEAHGGRIFVEDNQPKGSVFTIEI